MYDSLSQLFNFFKFIHILFLFVCLFVHVSLFICVIFLKIYFVGGGGGGSKHKVAGKCGLYTFKIKQI